MMTIKTKQKNNNSFLDCLNYCGTSGLSGLHKVVGDQKYLESTQVSNSNTNIRYMDG